MLSILLLAASAIPATDYNDALDNGKAMFGQHPLWSRQVDLGTISPPKIPKEYEIGDWGFDKGVYSVLGKVGDNEALLINVYNNQGRTRNGGTYLLRGLPTDKLVAQRLIVIQHPIVVSGTHDYKTVAGDKFTVLVLEVSEEKLKEALENAQYRTWTTDKGKTIEAKFLNYRLRRVYLETKDGDKLKLRFHNLSEEDQEWVEAERERQRKRR